MIRYNCTNSYTATDNAAKNTFTVISKERLRRSCYQGVGDYGSVTICPGANVTLQTSSESVGIVPSCYVQNAVYTIDLGKPENKRYGDLSSTTAKSSEYFLYQGSDDVPIKQIMLTYKCFRSLVMGSKGGIALISLLLAVDEDVPYSLTADTANGETYMFTLQSDFFCMTQDEETGFAEIQRRMLPSNDVQKAIIVGDEG